MRQHVTHVIQDFVDPGDWVVMSDVDEIPERHVLGMFKLCEGGISQGQPSADLSTA